MSSAAFDTQRRALGLSIGETAELLEINEKSLNRWMRDEVTIPDWATVKLDDLDDLIEDRVEQVLAFARQMDAPIPLMRYRTLAAYRASDDKAGLPLGAHAILVARAVEALASDGYACSIVWADTA